MGKKDNSGKRVHHNEYEKFSKARQNLARVGDTSRKEQSGQSKEAAAKSEAPPATETRHHPMAGTAERFVPGKLPINILVSRAEWIATLLPYLASGENYEVRNAGRKTKVKDLWGDVIIREEDPTIYDFQKIKAQIEKAFTLLTDKYHKYEVTVPGYPTVESLREAIDAAYAAGKEAIAEKERGATITNIADSLQSLTQPKFYNQKATDYLADIERTVRRIRVGLETLGEHADRAYPKLKGITTAEQMNAFLDETVEKLRAKHKNEIEEEQRYGRIVDTRQMFDQFGSPTGFFSRNVTPQNPDVALTELQNAIRDNLGGDLTKLTTHHLEHRTVEALETAIEEKHDRAILYVGERRLERRYGVSFNIRFDDLDNAKLSVDLGLNSERYIESVEEDINFWSKSKAEIKTQIEAIKAEASLNSAMHFAIVTFEYAQKGEPHAVMLEKTLRRIARIGGVKKLDGIIKRLHLAPEEWENIKAFLAEAALKQEAAPIDSTNYRAETRQAGALPARAPTVLRA